MKFIGYLGFRLVVFLFWLMPFWLMYLISDGLSFLFFHMIKYRKKMILENLKTSFPEKSDKEILKICKQSYDNLSDILLEGIKGLSMSEKTIIKRYKVLENEELNALHASGKSVIGVTAHMTNWEWGVASCGLLLRHHVLGVYKKLSQPYINHYIFNSRNRTNVTLSEMKETDSNMRSGQVQSPYLLMLIADQRPADPYKAFWTQFLGRDTAFHFGAEKYSIEFDLPVFYFNIRRIRRGFYEVDVLTLVLDPSKEGNGSIIESYAKTLETEVSKRPSDWLWSHSRWKHPKPADLNQG